jgi:RNA polymerase sigma-70 factor, ECF subfamily
MAAIAIDVIEQEIPRLRRFARCLVCDADLADDMVQQCLLRALDKVDTWPSDANPRAGLLAILHGCHLDQAGRAAPLPVRNRAAPTGRPPSTVNGHVAPVTLAELRDAFMRLTEDDREILLLVVVEELDYGQAAGILGISVATVRSRLAGARQALRSASGSRSIMPVAHSA